MIGRREILTIALATISFVVYGQYRTFVFAGFTQSYGGNLNTYLSKSPAQVSVDVEIDKKVFGALHLVSGLSTYGVGYSSTRNFWGPADSDYSARFLSVPLLARWNIGNRNLWYIDLGIAVSYLAQAHLKESLDKFGSTETHEGNIGPYLNRFYQVVKFQETVAINRFIISLFLLFEIKGQGTINNLPDHWGFNAQQSTFINSNGYSDFYAFGMKVGCRIR